MKIKNTPWVWAGLFAAAGCGALALVITTRGSGRVPPALAALALLGTAGLVGLQAATGFLPGSANDMGAWVN